jgi:uncharacterized protein (TIGR02001 family)
MNRILVPTLIAAAVATLSGLAQAAEPESTLAFNAGVVSDYRYRGISQSRLDAALQGGVDYADKSGFYVGAWGSTIRWIKDSSTVAVPVKGPFELDLYGGYKGVAGDLSYDLGFLRYEYVDNTLGKRSPVLVNANTNEVYGALSYGVFTGKYSHALSDLFGNPNSRNSSYLDLSATLDLGEGYSLVPHMGYQTVRNTSPDASYTDYSLTLGKDLGNGLSASGALVGTNASKAVYVTPDGKFTGKSSLVLGLKYSF